MDSPLQREALAYWQLCQKYRACVTEAGRAAVLYVDVPAFLGRAENPRIIFQLNALLETNNAEQETVSS